MAAPAPADAAQPFATQRARVGRIVASSPVLREIFEEKSFDDLVASLSREAVDEARSRSIVQQYVDNIETLSTLNERRLRARRVLWHVRRERGAGPVASEFSFAMQMCRLVGYSTRCEIMSSVDAEVFYIGDRLNRGISRCVEFIGQSCPSIRQCVSRLSVAVSYCDPEFPDDHIFCEYTDTIFRNLEAQDGIVGACIGRENRPEVEARAHRSSASVACLAMIVAELKEISETLGRHLFAVKVPVATQAFKPRKGLTDGPDACLLKLNCALWQPEYGALDRLTTGGLKVKKVVTRKRP